MRILLLALLLGLGLVYAQEPSTRTIPLNAGWNPVAFEGVRLTSLSGGVLAAYYGPGGYDVGPVTLERAQAGEGGRRACWVFASTATTLSYAASDEATALQLQNGWNLVSFARPSALASTSLRADGGPLSPRVSTTFYLLEANGSATPVDVAGNATLLPGRAYWVFATQASMLTWATEPVIPPLATLSLTPANNVLNRFGSVQLTARGQTAAGNSVDVSSSAQWTSSVPSAVGVGPTGLATGLFPGEYVVTATLQGLTATCNVTVLDRAAPPAPSPPRPAGRLFVGDFTTGGILSFANASTITGPVAPTSNRPFSSVGPLAFDPGRDVLYAGRIGTNSDLRVYSPSTATTPLRTLTLSALQSGLALDSAADRLFVGMVSGDIQVFDNASTATSATPSRTLTGFGTQIHGLALDPAAQRLFVTSNFSTTNLDVIDNAGTAAGARAAVVSRSFTLPADGQEKRGLAWDGTRSLLYVGNQDAAAGSIYVYPNAGLLSGAVAPARTLTGGATGLRAPRSLFIDPVADELYVANQGTGGTGTVAVFANASTASGGPAPVRSLPTSPPTLLVQPLGITVDFTRN